MNFDAKLEMVECIEWIKEWFEKESGGAKGFAIGMSGGKDSTVAAALCARAIGKENVLGILMPNKVQLDIEDSKKAVEVIGMKSQIINIGESYQALFQVIEESVDVEFNRAAQINILPRVRMTILYAIAQTYGYRVCGTSNFSEKYIGYSTKWGDNVSDFNPLGDFTSEEVVMIGEALGLPEDLIYKKPADGLRGKTDEDNFGFTYKVLNQYIKSGVCEDEEIKAKIDWRHKISHHKREVIPYFKSNRKS